MIANHMIGCSPARNPDFAYSEENLRLMRDAMMQYPRVFVSFPFVDEAMTQVTEQYTNTVADIRRMASLGFTPFATFAPAGGQSFNPQTGLVQYNRRIPAWAGGVNEDKYYAYVEKAAEYMARELKDLTNWWQVGNEPDIDTTIGDMTLEQNAGFLRAVASGLKKGNPDAQSGINLAGVAVMGGGDGTLRVHSYAKDLIQALYFDGGLFAYIGLDGYFGTWSGGVPADWKPYIDQAAEVAKKPVIISEWGYSTLQRGKPRPEKDKNRTFNSVVCREKDWDAGGGSKWLGKDHNEELQADYNAQCVKIFAEHPAVIGNLYFQWQDQKTCWQCGEPDCPAECGWGCIRVDGTPKPGYYGLRDTYKKYFG